VAGQDERTEDQQALVEAVADHLASVPDPQRAATQLGRAWGARLAGDPGGEPDVLEVLARQGFTPAPSPAGIVLQTCPLLTAARRRPEIVCGIHRGMLEAVAGRPVVLVPFGAPDGCLVTDPGMESLPHAGAPDSSR
jgi:predicted ArsR family transcriptional regulator